MLSATPTSFLFWLTVWVLTLSNSVLESNAYALQEEFPFFISNSKVEAEKADKIKVLSMLKSEWSIKGDLIRKKLEDPKLSLKESEKPDTFQKLKSHAYEFNSLNQSWLAEVDELFKERGTSLSFKKLKRVKNIYVAAMKGSQIDLAKKIAKRQLYYKVIENWSCRNRRPNKDGQILCLNQTIFNRDGIPDDAAHTKEGLGFIIDAFNQSFLYAPNEPDASPNYFLFKIADLGYVEIEKRTLKKGRVVFKTGNEIDNKPPPEAATVKADNDPSLSKDSNYSYHSKSKASNSTNVEIPANNPDSSPETGVAPFPGAPGAGGPNSPQGPPPPNGGPNTFDDDSDF